MLDQPERDAMLTNVERWIQKAENEPDAFDRYVSYFIAFNILYNMYAKEKDSQVNLLRDESKRAVEIKDLILNKDMLVGRLRNDLQRYLQTIPVFKDEYWQNQSISRRLEQSFDKHDSERVVEYLLRWLYRVRCNLVHGDKIYNQAEQNDLLRQSSHLLAEILSAVLADYRSRYC